jgi:branched-chain amino acid transport system ATP-binding protein
VDNVAIAAQRVAGIGLRMVRPASAYRDIQRVVIEHVAAAGLFKQRNDRANALSHGERRQLDLAMALAAQPRVLLLDEPTAGLSEASTAQFINLLPTLEPEITTVIVEHHTDLVFRIATHVTVLHQGAILADGPPHQVRNDAGVQRSYLGDGVAQTLFHEDYARRSAARPHSPARASEASS